MGDPGEPIGPWTPPSYEVDHDGKIIGRAAPEEPHNWGRWGADDQCGTANLLTDDRAVDGARLVSRGTHFSLALPLGGEQVNAGTREPLVHVFTRTTGDVVLGDPGPHRLQSSDDLIILPLQGSTQLDGLAHVGSDDCLYNGYWAGAVTASNGARRLGIHHLANGIVGRGVLLDVARHASLDPFDDEIGPALLDATARAQGVELRPGDVLLVRTGWLGAWLDDPAVRRRQRQSGLSLATIPWLATRDIAMVAVDNRAVEVIPGPSDRPVLSFHIAAIRNLGLLLGELFALDTLAADCAADGVYQFMFVAMPMPIVNAVGSPLNPVAIK